MVEPSLRDLVPPSSVQTVDKSSIDTLKRGAILGNSIFIQYNHFYNFLSCRYKNHMMHHQTEAFSCDCPDAPVPDPVTEHDQVHALHYFRKRGPKFYALERHMKVVHLGWLPCAQCEFISETEEKLSNHLEKCQMTFVCHKCVGSV